MIEPFVPNSVVCSFGKPAGCFKSGGTLLFDQIGIGNAFSSSTPKNLSRPNNRKLHAQR